MKGKQIVAIDVGSTNVVIAVGAVEDDGRVEILGIASEHVEGINAGRVDNSETAGAAVKIAKERLEAQLGIKITEAYVGLAGDYIRCVQVTDHVYVQDELGNGSNQITERDLEDLHRRMNSVKLPDDREEIVAKEKEAQELKRKYFGPEGELYKKRESLMAPIQDEIYNAVKEISDTKGYSVVVDRASAASIIYASPKIDISNEVLIKLGYAN